MVKYEQIASRISKKILTGTLAPGAKLPSEKDLSEEFDVSAQTINKALSILVTSGRIERKNGLGSFVSESLDFEELKKTERFVIGILLDRSISSIPGADTVLGKIAYNLQTILHSSNFQWLTISEKDGMDVHEKLSEVDGLITLGDVKNESIHLIKDMGLPCVTFHRDYSDMGPSAVLESNTGIEQLVSTLSQKDIKKFLFVSDDSNKQIYRLRESSFRNELCDKGYQLDSLVVPRAHLDAWSLDENNLEKIKKYQMVLTSNDRTAIQLLQIFEKNGLKVPRDTGLCGYDNSFAGRHSHIPLTTIAYDPYEACEALVRVISDLIFKNAGTRVHSVDSWLILRKSTP